MSKIKCSVPDCDKDAVVKHIGYFCKEHWNNSIVKDLEQVFKGDESISKLRV